MLIDLAEHQNTGFVALKDIAERQGVSKKYLEQIVPIFNKSHILKTNRGFQGGYMLAHSPNKYTVGEILRLTDESLFATDLSDASMSQSESSGEYAMIPIWQKLNRIISEYLDGVTLQDVLELQQERYGNDYMI